MRKTHGESNKSKEWDAWSSMIQRCTNPKNKRYYTHGGRGITICERWLNSFECFLSDMGRAPSKEHSLERKDNDGNYELSNCKWATRIEQANNRRSNIRIDYLGRVQTLKQWCDELSLPYIRVKARIHRGYTPDVAFQTTESGLRIDSVMFDFNGKTQSITQWSKELKIPYTTLKRRIDKGKLIQLLS